MLESYILIAKLCNNCCSFRAQNTKFDLEMSNAIVHFFFYLSLLVVLQSNGATVDCKFSMSTFE